MSKNYYEILGVSKEANFEAIKKAYRDLSKEHHPDKGGDEEKFKEISEAYSILSDPNKRADYDNPMAGSFGGFNPFDQMFRQRAPRPPDPNAPRLGRNIMLEHMAPLKYFILGGKLKINFSFRDPCPDCVGTGAEEKETCNTCRGMGQVTEARQGQGVFIRSSRACPTCQGRGFIAKKPCDFCDGAGTRTIDKDLTLDIPPSIREGHVVGVSGQGGTGLNGGRNGDLGVKLFMRMPDPNKLTEGQKKVLEEI